jgi:hypothetical protein
LARLADRVVSSLQEIKMARFFASILVILTVGAATAAHSQDKTITVFAAASLKNALDDVDAAFEFGKLIADQTEKWAKVINFAGIKLE